MTASAQTARPHPPQPVRESGSKFAPLHRRFWSKVFMDDGCWEWRSGGKQHPTIQVGEYVWLASRVAWLLWHGYDPRPMFVLHKCDNRRCVRPDHLFLGTRADNNADRSRKGRNNSHKRRGEGNGSARLRAAEVLGIRQALHDGTATAKQLCERYGVGATTLNEIRLRKTWSHI